MRNDTVKLLYHRSNCTYDKMINQQQKTNYFILIQWVRKKLGTILAGNEVSSTSRNSLAFLKGSQNNTPNLQKYNHCLIN